MGQGSYAETEEEIVVYLKIKRKYLQIRLESKKVFQGEILKILKNILKILEVISEFIQCNKMRRMDNEVEVFVLSSKMSTLSSYLIF